MGGYASCRAALAFPSTFVHTGMVKLKRAVPLPIRMACASHSQLCGIDLVLLHANFRRSDLRSQML